MTRTYWILKDATGRTLNVDLDTRTGITTLWLDRGGNSPCFPTAEEAQTYIDRYVTAQHPTCAYHFSPDGSQQRSTHDLLTARI